MATLEEKGEDLEECLRFLRGTSRVKSEKLVD